METQMCQAALSYHIVSSYHIVDLKWQNRLKVGTNKPKLKVKMQSVSDDDVRKRLLEKPRFELPAKDVFRLGRCYIFWQGVSGLCNWKSTATDGWSLDRWHQKTIGACRTKRPSFPFASSQGLHPRNKSRGLAVSFSDQLYAVKYNN